MCQIATGSRHVGWKSSFQFQIKDGLRENKYESVIETQCPDVDLYKWIETNISHKTSPQLKSYV